MQQQPPFVPNEFQTTNIEMGRPILGRSQQQPILLPNVRLTHNEQMSIRERLPQQFLAVPREHQPRINKIQNAQPIQKEFVQTLENNPNFAHQRQPVKPRETFLRRLRCIPKFNGENYSQLKEFIEVSESLYISCLNEAETNELYEQILLQLRGEARNVVIALNNPNWEIIKNKLLKYFSHLANKEILTSQLENARQEENETLTAFADRVRKLLREKNATYSHTNEEQRMEYNRRIISRPSVKSFRPRK